ncbi:MAG: class I SAM-dependent methyltransferase [Chthoniobacterales bacterium]
MENQTPRSATHREACTGVASHFTSRWLRHYAASKLRSDPVFAAAFELLRQSRAPLLDVGCGVGLLPFYLRERGLAQAITGLDIDGPKIRRGRAVAREHYRDIDLREQDVATADEGEFRGDVVIFDLLHYLTPAAQRNLLERLAAYVPPGGLLLIRDSLRDGSARFWITYAGEIFAQTVSWNIGVQLHFPRRVSIHSMFPEEEWTRHEQPAWGRTPFNNRLFIFQRRWSEAVPTAE